MADKKPAKKDDKKSAPAPSPNGHDYLVYFIGGIVAFLVLTTALSSTTSPIGAWLKRASTDSTVHTTTGGVNGIAGSTNAGANGAAGQGDQKVVPLNDSFINFLFSPSDTYPAPGKLVADTSIVTERKTAVRVEPGGPIIGSQSQGARGIISGGPVIVNGVRYYSVRYDQAPDGWVREADITSYISTYNTIHFLPNLFSILHTLSVILAFVFGGLAIYAYYKFNSLGAEEKKKEKEAEAVAHIVALPVQNERWTTVKNLVESYNQNDWRQAIIEADIMLDEMLDRMQYVGKTMADKLKTVEPSDFATLDDAWEAHKVRNRIAHDGASYVLPQNEARRVIGLYEKVFKEFYFV